jgi:hypothetical protein
MEQEPRYRRTMSPMDAELTMFELQVCPSELRLAVALGQTALFGYKPTPRARPRAVTLRYEGNEESFKSILESLRWLLIANNVIESPQHNASSAFDPKEMNEPSLHLHVAFADGQKWGCVYPMEELPANLQSLVEQCKYLGHRDLETTVPVRDKPSAEETASAFSFDTAEGTGRPLARVRVTREGDTELNGTRLNSGDLFEALRVLRRQGGEVYYQEEAVPERDDAPARDAARFVLDAVRALGLPLTRCPEDDEPEKFASA